MRVQPTRRPTDPLRRAAAAPRVTTRPEITCISCLPGFRPSSLPPGGARGLLLVGRSPSVRLPRSPSPLSSARCVCRKRDTTVSTHLSAPLLSTNHSVRLQVQPIGERIVVKVGAAETKTTGGILLPAESQRRPTSGERHSRDAFDGGCEPGHWHFEKSSVLPFLARLQGTSLAWGRGARR